MTDRTAPTTTLILARSMAGAQAAARLVGGNALSIVEDQVSDDTRARAHAEHYSAILVECTTDDLAWLAAALDLAASLVRPGTSIRLVIGEGAVDPEITGPIADMFAGWLITGVAVQGDVLSLELSPTSTGAERQDTVESLNGAFLIEAALRVVKDPAAHDLDEFEYRSSMMTSYLTEIPRLHAEIESLRAQLNEPRSAIGQSRPSGGEKPVSAPAEPRDPGPQGTIAGPTRVNRRRPRLRKLALVACAGIVWLGLAALITKMWDLRSGGFLTLLVLGAVVAGALDSRRRAKTLLGATRQAAAGAKALKRIGPTLSKQHSATIRAVGDASARHAEASQRHATQIGTQVASGVASSARSVVGQVAAAIDTSDRRSAERTAQQTTEIKQAMPRIPDVHTIVRAELLKTYQQLEANLQLRDLVEVGGPTPPLRGWAASPDVLVFLIHEMRRLNPGLVVECGSGASTVWLAMASKSAGLASKIVALEHEPTFAAETSRLLAECGVSEIAEVRVAPLEETTIGDESVLWYARAALHDLDSIGLLFVDGPPGTISRHARYPALPILRPKLNDPAVVVLDDVVRETEQEIADRWAAEFPELTVDNYRFEKGAAVFRLDGRAVSDT